MMCILFGSRIDVNRFLTSVRSEINKWINTVSMNDTIMHLRLTYINSFSFSTSTFDIVIGRCFSFCSADVLYIISAIPCRSLSFSIALYRCISHSATVCVESCSVQNKILTDHTRARWTKCVCLRSLHLYCIVNEHRCLVLYTSLLLSAMLIGPKQQKW